MAAFWLPQVSDFSSCWLLTFSIDRLLALGGLGGAKYGVLGNVVTACFLTILSFSIIYLLDKQADSEAAIHEELRKQSALRTLMTGEQNAVKMHSRRKTAMRATVLAGS